jgi:hypothetical protein
MGYYRGDVYGFRGDYYRGDYYQGDPGLFSFVGKALGGLAKGALNLAKGQLGIPTFKATQPPQGIMRSITAGLGGTGPGSLVQYNGGSFGPTLPGGHGSPQLPMLPGQRHRALHWNRETYVTRGGGTSRWPQQILVHPKGTEAVPSRRMNVGNARALRRALRRAHGFARLARRVMSLTHPRAKGRLTFKKKSRRAA